MLIINVQKNARKNINVDGTADDGKKTANHDVKTLLATRDLLDAYQAYRVLYSAKQTKKQKQKTNTIQFLRGHGLYDYMY